MSAELDGLADLVERRQPFGPVLVDPYQVQPVG
jgi:hypothetical protein